MVIFSGLAGSGVVGAAVAAHPPSVTPAWGYRNTSIEVWQAGMHCPAAEDDDTEDDEPDDGGSDDPDDGGSPEEMAPDDGSPTPEAEVQDSEDGPFQVIWDGGALRSGTTDPVSGIRTIVQIPADAAPGVHEVTVRCELSGVGPRPARVTVIPGLEIGLLPSSAAPGHEVTLRVRGLYCRPGGPPGPGGVFTVLWEQAGAVLASSQEESAEAAFSQVLRVPEDAGPRTAVVTVRCVQDLGAPARAALKVTRRDEPSPSHVTRTPPTHTPVTPLTPTPATPLTPRPPTHPPPTGGPPTEPPSPTARPSVAPTRESSKPTRKAGRTPRPALTVDPASARRGQRVLLRGEHFPRGCAHPRIFLDTRRVSPDDLRGGTAPRAAFTVPRDLAAGGHVVRFTCATKGTAMGLDGGRATLASAAEVSATASLNVWEQVAARFAIPRELASLHDLRFDPEKVATSLTGALLLALLVFAPFLVLPLVGFPPDIVNKVLEENAGKGRRWPTRRAVARIRAALRPRAKLLLFTAVATVLLTLTSPDARVPAGDLAGERFSMANMAALGPAFFLAVLITTLTYGWVPRAVTFRGVETTTMRVLPGALVLAVLCGLLSLAAGFQPGYVYGLVAVFEVRGARAGGQDHTTEGRAVLVASVLTTAVAVALLAAWARIDQAMDAGELGGLTRLVDLFLSTVTLTMISTVVFALLPLRFLDGYSLFRWDRRAWAAVFVPVTFCFGYLTLINTTAPLKPSDVVEMVRLFGAFGALSILTWLYFVLREKRRERRRPGT
ncbi:FGLLP motif-containing membrane protein [Sphaerisporangium corydalis]|uniref:FGLLP motif-containing membrane protein n=1 Tax=Sphaerisporangium corydalis TaxID=1441875 RepID=A0ABV9EUK8_9ACTN